MTEDLTDIDGVGPAIAEQLHEAGFETVDEVLAATVDELADVHMLGESSATAILEEETDAGPRGRPSKFSDDRARAAIKAARLGKSKAGCARDAGVGEASIERWLEQDELAFEDENGEVREFRSAFRRARGNGETEYIEGGRDTESDIDPSFAKFMLSSSYGYKKTEKREHTGEDGGPVEVEVNETVVETGWEE